MIKITSRHNLSVANPKLAQEWHPSKNGKLTPKDVTPMSHKKVWWQCDKGHEWEALVKSRFRGNGCSYCSNHKVCKDNCLATVNPKLANEWHPSKNGKLTPEEITSGSLKKVWWKCPRGDDHEWEASIKDRKTGNGCPVCSNHKVVKSNSLSTLNPELAREWHPTKNGNLTPQDVTPGSNKKVWWKCPKGDDHEWKTSINHRSSGTGCPCCNGQKLCESNCLAIINPELAAEWHPTKNGKLTAKDVTPFSNIKTWWVCKKKHEWRATVNSRSSGNGCSFCGGKKACEDNCLAIKNPKLAKEWHPSKNGSLTPKDVTCGSSKRVWWKCTKGQDHEWQAAVSNRTAGGACPKCKSLATLFPKLIKEWHPSKNGTLTPYDVEAGSAKKTWWKCPKGEDHEWQARIHTRQRGVGCPVCANLKIVKSNSLAAVNPKLAKEWHPTKNGALTPHDVGAGSGKKVWWQCKFGHEWQTSIDHRKNGKACPFCFNPSSVPELRIYCELKTLFPSIQHRIILKGYEVDIHIPELHIGIEYDGEYWHRNKMQKDREKNLALNSTLLLIRVREKGLPKISDADVELKTTYISVALIKKILQSIVVHRRIESPEVSARINEYFSRTDWIASDRFDKLSCEKNHIAYEKSLNCLFPKVAKEWHPTKNDPLLPEYFTPGSNKKVWWKCPKGDDHEWISTISNRTLGRGCPICCNRKTANSNSLAMVNPELAKEWHPTNNGKLTPYDVGAGSAKKVWWKCPKGDDHEWQAVVSSRKQGVGCSICSNKKVVKSNSLANLNPNLAKEWHPQKNGNLKPHDVPPGSHKMVWWRCPKSDDHDWKAIVKSRSRGNGCPYCAGRKSNWRQLILV